MHIGLLTAGGDCAGLNGAIRAVVRKAISLNHRVAGIHNGWLGLIENDIEPLESKDASRILSLGGTILGASRVNPDKIEKGYEKICGNIQKRQIDGLIVIGGDGTFAVSLEVIKRGTPVIGIPKTIDNDVYGTDYCIGFDSAVSIVAGALDNLHTTAYSHHRIMVVEVMGRTSGWIALYGGLGGGADWILIPEVPFSIDEVVSHIHHRKRMGKGYSIVVAAEGIGLMKIPELQGFLGTLNREKLDELRVGDAVARVIEERTGFETRVSVLGHLQRGGSPTLFDRILATRLGAAAVEELAQGRSGVMVGMEGNRVVTVPLEKVVANSPRGVDPKLYDLAKLFY